MECTFVCRPCGRSSTIDVPQLTFVGDDLEGPAYSVEVRCRHCGSHDVELSRGSLGRARLGLIWAMVLGAEHVRWARGLFTHGREAGLRDAEAVAREEAAKRPGDPEALVRLANTLRNVNRHNEAVAIYERVLGEHPDALEAALNLGEVFFQRWRIYRARGAKGLALRHFRTALELLATGKGKTWAVEKGFDVGEAIATRLVELGGMKELEGLGFPAPELDEAELARPLSELVGGDRSSVRIDDMERYAPVFFAVEDAFLGYWREHPELDDRRVKAALLALHDDPDAAPKDALGALVLKSLKSNLVANRNLGHTFQLGEVRSCVLHLARLARDHRADDGRGYLRWSRARHEAMTGHPGRGGAAIHAHKGG